MSEHVLLSLRDHCGRLQTVARMAWGRKSNPGRPVGGHFWDPALATHPACFLGTEGVWLWLCNTLKMTSEKEVTYCLSSLLSLD